MGVDPLSEVTGYAAHYAREEERKQADRRIWLTLDLLIARLTADRDVWRSEGEEGWAQGLNRAIEVLTISRDAHAG